MEESNIYSMGLHEIIMIGEVQIIRVAGGWIYNFRKGSEVFVPFSTEFN